MSLSTCCDECAPNNINIINSQYKNRILIEEKMAELLIDSYHFPLNCDSNGAFFINNNLFAANRTRLSSKFGITTNAINKDFRHHNIKCVQSFPLKSYSNLTDIKGWKIFQHSNGDFTLENILKRNTKFVSKWIKNDSKNKQKKSNKNIKQFKQIIKKEEKKIQEKKNSNTNEFSIFDFVSDNADSDFFSDLSDIFSNEDNYFM